MPEHQLHVPLLPPTNDAVPRIVPSPVAVPSQLPWLMTLPAGPGVIVNELNFNENSPADFPLAISVSPFEKFLFALTLAGCRATFAARRVSISGTSQIP